MTKEEEKIVNDQHPSDNPELLPGGFNDDAVTRGLLADAIKRSEQSRDHIADRMSFLLSTKVTVDMLNNFTADGKLAHRFPFAWARAFCQSTGDWRLLQHIAEQSGFLLLDKNDADLVSLGELVVQREQTEREIVRHSKNVIERRTRQ